MRLILEKENGIKVEIVEVSILDKDNETLFFFLNSHLRKENIEAIEKELQTKTNKNCVVLDSLYVAKIFGI